MNKKGQLEVGAIVGGILTLIGLALKNNWILLIAAILFLYFLGIFNSIFSMNIPSYIWIVIGIVMILWIINMGKGKR